MSRRLKLEAGRLGFAAVGICAAAQPAGIHRFHEWLSRGYAGEMHYLADRADAYADPKHVLDGVRSLVVLAAPYRTTDPQDPEPGEGRVSRYAWGADYHDLIRERLHKLADWLREAVPGCRARGVIDTAPLLEREFAQLAGLGWVGKNTLLLSPALGSYFFLAVLLTDAELEFDEPFETDHCGTCTACLDACPTQAFVAPQVLDATRCISYLTIEHRSSVPIDLRAPMGDWIFGCDICQDVCPWNQRAPHSLEPAFAPRGEQDPIDLAALFDMDEAAFRARFRDTPLWRAKRRGLLRNAAIVLGNQRATAALPALERGLQDDEPQIRGACAWALGQLSAREMLEERQPVEADREVQLEIALALERCARAADAQRAGCVSGRSMA